jgi:DNA-binding NtrC family response regulator
MEMEIEMKMVTQNASAPNAPPVNRSRPNPSSFVILIVDDDPPVRKVFEVAIRTFDYRVRSAANTTEALEIFRAEHIDLVLMDVQMPNGDGPYTLARLQEIDPEVVCCFTSGHTGKYDVDDLMKLGAVGFLQKPFRLDELRQLVMDAVG